MRIVSLIFVLLAISFSAVQAQDLIERDYFPNARAKNASIAAARYAEEGYHYTKFIGYLNAVDSSRMYADTALFFVKRALMLGDTALYHAPASNYAAHNYLNEALLKTGIADTIIREFYPMVALKSHHVFSTDAALHLSNSVMDFFNASLVLKAENEAPISEEERYEVLPFDDEVVRLEADEATFQLASNEFEMEINELDQLLQSMDSQIEAAPNQASRQKIRQQRGQVEVQISETTNHLQDASSRIQEIRHLLDKKYLDDVKDVELPESRAQFETASKVQEIEMNPTVPKGLVYKIQLGYYPSDVDITHFHGLFPISGETVREDLGRYYAGVFYTYSDASEGNIYVRENAIPNAFVVPFLNGKKISVSQAVEIERQRGDN